MAYKPKGNERTEETDVPTETPFNADTILAEKERQEKELRENAMSLPEGVQEANGISIVSGQYKLVARPKSGELSFTPELKPEDKAAGKVAKPIKYKNINAVILTGTGKPAGKPGQVRIEILPLDWLRLIQNAMNDRAFVRMMNLMADEERAKAVSTENWKVPGSTIVA